MVIYKQHEKLIMDKNPEKTFAFNKHNDKKNNVLNNEMGMWVKVLPCYQYIYFLFCWGKG